MEREINQELKQKALKLLTDEIDTKTFERSLYQLVGSKVVNSKTLLFDFININYKEKNHRSKLLNLIESYCSEEELLSLRVYTLCQKLSTSDNQIEILDVVNLLSDLNRQTDYQYDILYEFYMLNDNTLGDGFHYYSLTKEEVASRAKSFSKKVISEFNVYKEEDWFGFLNCVIEKEEEKKEQVIKGYSLEVKSSENISVFRKIGNLLKGMFGMN
ncbi:hypothetical protein [uncultured Tenacibaculum sp.]|uniref:hypothetical protein n=1 Tax=uncultured Tenacibaculum sp. TaxID=174713 RepID=UPI00261F2E1A|nr:hypothetical protein [uncultured Tenacibaculum sp.]